MDECPNSLGLHAFRLDIIEVRVVLIAIRTYSFDEKFIYQEDIVDRRIVSRRIS